MRLAAELHREHRGRRRAADQVGERAGQAGRVPAADPTLQDLVLVGDAAGADPLFGEGISIALGYGVIAAREIGEAFQRNEFSFSRYRRRVLQSALGQTLIARWIIAYVLYPIKWKWFQVLLWRIMKPIVIVTAWLFVLNWGKRLNQRA